MQAANLPNFIFVISEFLHLNFVICFNDCRDQYSSKMSTKIMNIIKIDKYCHYIVTVYRGHTTNAPKHSSHHSAQPSV